jgi:MFS family permease
VCGVLIGEKQPFMSHPAPLLTRNFITVWMAQFIGGLGAASFILFPLFIKQLGGSEITIGTCASVGGAAAVLTRIPVGRLLDSIGRKRVLSVAALLQAVSFALFIPLTSLDWKLFTVVALNGASAGALFASYTTYASDVIPVSRRAQGFALFSAGGMLPNGLSPWIGERIIAYGGFSTFLFTAALFSVGALVLVQLLPELHAAEQRNTQTPEPPHVTAGPGEIRFLLGLAFLFGVAICSVFTFLAPFGLVSGRSGVGNVFLAYALSAVSVRVLTIHWVERIGRGRVLLAAYVAFALAVGMIPHMHSDLAWVATGILAGAAHGYAYPIPTALVVNRVGALERGRTLGWFTAMFDLGNMLGNPVLGATAEWLGYSIMYSGVAVIMAAGAALIAMRRLK